MSRTLADGYSSFWCLELLAARADRSGFYGHRRERGIGSSEGYRLTGTLCKEMLDDEAPTHPPHVSRDDHRRRRRRLSAAAARAAEDVQDRRRPPGDRAAGRA